MDQSFFDLFLDRNCNHRKAGFFTWYTLCEADNALGSKFTFLLFFYEWKMIELALNFVYGISGTLWASILE